MATFVFDLDMTLLDTSLLERWRERQQWDQVRRQIGTARPFATGKLAPHDLPARLKENGHDIAVVTSSPRWYANRLIKDFKISTDVVVAWDDTELHKPDPEPINMALEQLGADPEQSYCVGDSIVDVRACYHAGIVSIGAGWGVRNFEEFSSAAPDVLLRKPSSLLRFNKLERRGYLAEVLCAGKTPKVHRGSFLPSGSAPQRYSLGRYFKTEDPRHSGSALAASLLDLKSKDRSAEAIGKALVAFIRRLEWTPDFVVPVPSKPNQTRNRFEAVLKVVEPHVDDNTEVDVDGLRCVREIRGYRRMRAFERSAAVRGAFESNYDWDGRKVLLLDDVLTTGATAKECARVLSKNNASEVRIVALGRDQHSFASRTCPECRRPMRIRTNRYTNEKFWGCSGYPKYCENTEDI
ncbi:MAG: HAD-IA family hydrolase [Bryobacterales bacterium]|nr:HAD-IA family hydrolase [Bryobacterales bacterium]